MGNEIKQLALKEEEKKRKKKQKKINEKENGEKSTMSQKKENVIRNVFGGLFKEKFVL